MGREDAEVEIVKKLLIDASVDAFNEGYQLGLKAAMQIYK